MQWRQIEGQHLQDSFVEDYSWRKKVFFCSSGMLFCTKTLNFVRKSRAKRWILVLHAGSDVRGEHAKSTVSGLAALPLRLYCVGNILLARRPSPWKTSIHRFVNDFHIKSCVFVQNSVCDEQKTLLFSASELLQIQKTFIGYIEKFFN